MPLPETVINQITNEPAETQGWFFGISLFAIVILVVTIGVYLGIKFGYEPYLNSRISSAQAQVQALSQSVPSANESQLLAFYSQVSNLQSVLANHVLFSQFLSWLEQNTENNVSYAGLSFTSASGDQITLTGTAPSEADVNQQIAIFQSSPEVESFSVSNVQAIGVSGQWTFGVALVMNPSVFLAANNTTSTNQ